MHPGGVRKSTVPLPSVENRAQACFHFLFTRICILITWDFKETQKESHKVPPPFASATLHRHAGPAQQLPLPPGAPGAPSCSQTPRSCPLPRACHQVGGRPSCQLVDGLAAREGDRWRQGRPPGARTGQWPAGVTRSWPRPCQSWGTSQRERASRRQCSGLLQTRLALATLRKAGSPRLLWAHAPHFHRQHRHDFKYQTSLMSLFLGK